MSIPISPPVIGIVCMDDQPTRDTHRPRYGQNQTYVHAVAEAGAVPVLIPLLSDKGLLRAAYGLLDGLLLPGGDDVHPQRYGEPIHPACRDITPVRDEVEITVALWAVEDGKPVLGICRGIQVLNVALGGSLYQDIQAQAPGGSRHDWYPGFPRDHLPHAVAISPGSRLAALVQTDTLPVNSLHHQAIKNLAPGLIATARSPDGIIEAVEGPGPAFCVAVQWHPEELAGGDPRARRLFAALVVASSGS